MARGLTLASQRTGTLPDRHKTNSSSSKPSFSGRSHQVFDRVRAGEELLHPIAEGCLSLLRELIRCSTAGATSAAAAPGKSGGRRSRKGGRGNGGGSGGASTLDAAGKSSLLAGLRGAFPLLMETDSHSLVQVRFLKQLPTVT